MSDTASNPGADRASQHGSNADDPPRTEQQEQRDKDLALAIEKGWTNPIPFQYDTVVGGSAQPDDTRADAPWLSQAVIYEWDDDFGEIGPENKELEAILFQDPTMQRVGDHVKALLFEVTVQGEDPVLPVRDVSF
jgi:ATP-dependent RNA helicase DDX3X